MIKPIVRKILYALHIDITRGMRYDRMTGAVMRKVLRRDSNCVDVGAHTGDILSEILRIAPQGNHFGFEPIPELMRGLQQRFRGNANVHLSPIAISTHPGSSTFHIVENAKEFSGLRKRLSVAHKGAVRDIPVQTDALDNIIPDAVDIALIKIDVEGGEYDVLVGGKNVILRCRPVIVFECGIGGSDYFGTTAELMYALITDELHLRLHTLHGFLTNQTPLPLSEFQNLFATGEEYYFLAGP